MKMVKSLLIAASITFVGAVAAFGAGLWNGYPIVGGPSYCASTVNNSCVSTIAGVSSSLTGYIPMDTRLGSGQNPQTALVPGSMMGVGVQNVVPLAGDSITVANNNSNLFLNPAGTLATLTITLPAAANLFDGQKFYLNSSQIVTALTLTAGSGTTLGTSTTALAVNTPIRYTYMAATKVWIKG